MMALFSREEKLDKQAIFRNGKILLEKLIASPCNGKCNPICGFTSKDLKMATNNYDVQRIITAGTDYTFYKGFLKDRPISVMKFRTSVFDPDQCSFNCIVFASQMNHKNILKLIGCCLETQFPMLVFESVEFGTLANRIYGPFEPHFEPLVLTYRLRIAMEIANAIAYLHGRFPRPIVFRIIKLSNIVFHQQYVAKLFDFSLSVSIPKGETHIQDDAVKGTFGFIAPEYAITCKFNEKLDVYSFGAVLLELLTGKKIVDETCDYCHLEDRVKQYIEHNRFTEIVDPILIVDTKSPGNEQQLQAFAELSFRCLSKSAEDRPTMIDVAKQLRRMYLQVN